MDDDNEFKKKMEMYMSILNCDSLEMFDEDIFTKYYGKIMSTITQLNDQGTTYY